MTVVQPRPNQSDANRGDGFEAFYTATMERTFLAARRIAVGDRDLAFDATQDAYVTMLQRWAVRCHKPLAANHNYVVRIAANKVLDRLRRSRRLVSLDDDCDLPIVEDPSDELVTELSKQSVLRAVRELIDVQPARRRAVVTLYFLHDVGYTEVAATLGMTEC